MVERTRCTEQSPVVLKGLNINNVLPAACPLSAFRLMLYETKNRRIAETAIAKWVRQIQAADSGSEARFRRKMAHRLGINRG